MKTKGKIMTSAAVVAVVAVGGYMLLRPQPTPDDVIKPVDLQYEQISIQLNDLNAKVQQPGANVDSLTQVFESISWSPVDNGGEYETQLRNLYIDAKRNVAMTIRKVLLGRGDSILNPHINDPESISE